VRLLRDDPAAIVAAHRAYFDAGAEVAITASYHASYGGFRAAGFTDEETTALLALSVALAREARPADRPTFVAGSVGLYGVVWANGTEYTGDYTAATDDAIATEQRARIAGRRRGAGARRPHAGRAICSRAGGMRPPASASRPGSTPGPPRCSTR
jgi:S-methylmethionine-dependent homocysteine/selenocysteine methylase